MPPTAGETQMSTSPTAERIFAARALQRRSVLSGCWKTRFFWIVEDLFGVHGALLAGPD